MDSSMNGLVGSTPVVPTTSRPLIRIKTITTSAPTLPVSKPSTAISDAQSPTPTASAWIWTGPPPLPRRPLTPHPEAIRSGMSSNPSTPLICQDGLWSLGKRHRRPLHESLSPRQSNGFTDNTLTPIATLQSRTANSEMEEESPLVDEFVEYIPANNDASTLGRINENETVPTPISAIRIFSPLTTTCAFPWSNLESHRELKDMIMPV